MAASRRESPNQLAMSVMGMGGVSCAKLSHGERKNSLTSSSYLSHASQKKKKKPGLISDVCQGHIRGRDRRERVLDRLVMSALSAGRGHFCRVLSANRAVAVARTSSLAGLEQNFPWPEV